MSYFEQFPKTTLIFFKSIILILQYGEQTWRVSGIIPTSWCSHSVCPSNFCGTWDLLLTIRLYPSWQGIRGYLYVNVLCYVRWQDTSFRSLPCWFWGSTQPYWEYHVAGQLRWPLGAEDGILGDSQQETKALRLTAAILPTEWVWKQIFA